MDTQEDGVDAEKTDVKGASEKAIGERAVANANVMRASQDGVEMARAAFTQNVVGRASAAGSGIGRDWSGMVRTCRALNIVIVT